MRKVLDVLKLAGLCLWVLLLAVLFMKVSRQDVLGALWSPRGLLGLLSVLLVAALAVAGLSVASLLAFSLWPARVRRHLALLEAWPVRCALVGVLVLLSEVWLCGVLPPHRLTALLCLLADAVALAQGFPAVAELAGERLGLSPGPRAAAVGTAVVACGSTVPVVGWLMGATAVFSALGAPFVPGGLR